MVCVLKFLCYNPDMGSGKGRSRRAQNVIAGMEEQFGVDPKVMGSVPSGTLAEIEASIATLTDEERKLIVEHIGTVTKGYLHDDDLADRALKLVEGKVAPGEEVRFDAVNEVSRIENNFGRGPNKLRSEAHTSELQS